MLFNCPQRRVCHLYCCLLPPAGSAARQHSLRFYFPVCRCRHAPFLIWASGHTRRPDALNCKPLRCCALFASLFHPRLHHIGACSWPRMCYPAHHMPAKPRPPPLLPHPTPDPSPPLPHAGALIMSLLQCERERRAAGRPLCRTPRHSPPLSSPRRADPLRCRAGL